MESLDQLPSEGAKDRETAEELGFVAFATIPLNVGMHHIGLVSAASMTHTVSWTEELQHRLHVIGDVVASALVRCWSEESLRLSEERFGRAMIGSSDGFWDWPDLGEKHQWWSPRLYELLGFADREMEARFDDALGFIHPDDHEGAIEAIQRHLVDGEVFDIEFRVRQKGGCYIWMRARGEAVHHESGGFTSMSGSARDISDRKAAEEQLRKRDDVLRRTERLARVGGWELDPATGEMYWTDEVKRIHGVPPDYVPTADSAVGFYAPEYIPKFQAVLEELQTSGKPWVLEFELITAQGERIWIESTGEAVWENGKIARLQGSFQDISERKGEEKTRRDLEAQVQQGQKLESLGVLAGGIAHDFNNLLVSILGHAGLALEDVPPGAKPHESIRQIEIAAERAADLAQQMLAYSGKGKFLIQPIDLSLLVREMSRLLEVSISKRSMVHLELEEALPAVEGDQTQLQQVVMNLITNASDALGDEPGDITLRTGVMTELKDESKTLFADDAPRTGSFVYVEVSDTGCGMSKDARARIFDPFFTTKFAGRGLGLAAVIGIVRGHHGGLYVDSEVGKGTTFRILFPAAEAVAKREKAATPPVFNGNGCESGTILVVDDEPSVRDFTARALERFGHRVVTAEDGPQALWILASQDPPVDVLLLDMTMPVMGGEEVVAAVRNTDMDIPILLMSGYSEQETRDRFAEGWVSGFLQKPFQIKVLRQKIETVLAQRQRIT